MFISKTLIAVALATSGASGAQAAELSPEQRAAKRCDQTHVKSCIKRAAIHHGQSFYDMKATAFCESTYNPYAENGPYKGLYQFDSTTWKHSPYGTHKRTSAKWSSLATAWYWKKGERSRWPVCG